jgi:FkbM family methyltransferase
VGASGGTKDNWMLLRKYIQVIGFEPDKREFANLIRQKKENSTKYLNTALYSEKASLDFFLARKQRVSSLLRPNEKFLSSFENPKRFDVLEVVKIETDTLDNQVREHKIGDVDFVKLDTQGSELFILKGAEQILRDSTFGLEIEVEFTQIYQDQPLFSDVDHFVRKFGFQLFDLRPCYWDRKVGNISEKMKGQIIFADAIYLKSIESLNSYLGKIDDYEKRKAKLIKSLLICLIYNHRDYGLELFEIHKNLFDEKEIRLFRQALEGKVSSSLGIGMRIPNFKGRARLSDGLYNLWKILQPKFARCIVYLRDGQRLEKW